MLLQDRERLAPVRLFLTQDVLPGMLIDFMIWAKGIDACVAVIEDVRTAGIDFYIRHSSGEYVTVVLACVFATYTHPAPGGFVDFSLLVAVTASADAHVKLKSYLKSVGNRYTTFETISEKFLQMSFSSWGQETRQASTEDQCGFFERCEISMRYLDQLTEAGGKQKVRDGIRTKLKAEWDRSKPTTQRRTSSGSKFEQTSAAGAREGKARDKAGSAADEATRASAVGTVDPLVSEGAPKAKAAAEAKSMADRGVVVPPVSGAAAEVLDVYDVTAAVELGRTFDRLRMMELRMMELRMPFLQTSLLGISLLGGASAMRASAAEQEQRDLLEKYDKFVNALVNRARAVTLALSDSDERRRIIKTAVPELVYRVTTCYCYSRFRQLEDVLVVDELSRHVRDLKYLWEYIESFTSA